MQVFYNTPEEVIILLLYIFSIMVTTQWNFYCLILSFLIPQRTKKSCNEASVMNMWFVNENLRSVNEKRMPTLKRKHDGLCRTVSTPGLKKLAFKPSSRKTAETEASFNSFHCFRLLKWGVFDKIFWILGQCGTFIWGNDQQIYDTGYNIKFYYF